MKTAYSAYEEKRRDYDQVHFAYEECEKSTLDKSQEEQELGKLFLKINTEVYKAKDVIDSFNSTIVEIHDYIMGNTEASFDIKIKDGQKSILAFVMRTYDDGSHSVNRTKVFIYDMALMLNEFTAARHPGLLIHDNIFDVDQDTLVQSLNYLSEKNAVGFQYILTLNRDKIESEERKGLLKFSLEQYRVATLTKKSQFLKRHYRELDAVVSE